MRNRMEEWGVEPGSDDAAMEEAKVARATSYGPGGELVPPLSYQPIDPRLARLARALEGTLPLLFEGDQGRHAAQRKALFAALADIY